MKILLDYVFPVTVIDPVPAASTAFLKQVCLVVKPASGVSEGLTLCTSMAAVEVLTDNLNAQQFFNAGMNRVYILASNDLDLATTLIANVGKFFTVVISDDFHDADITDVKATLVKTHLTFTAAVAGEGGNDITVAFITGGTAGSEEVTVTDKAIVVKIQSGTSTNTQIKAAVDANALAHALVAVAIANTYGGDTQTSFAATPLSGGVNSINVEGFECVLGLSTTDESLAAIQAALPKRAVFFTDSTNKAKNLCFAFGKLLANAKDWLNQQYVDMPVNDGVDSLGDANQLFDDKVSFVINDDEFGNKLGLFACGHTAIVAPYILKNLRIDLQSRALQWIAANEPQYTLTEAALLETRLQQDVINAYIARGWLSGGSIVITLEESNFVGSADIVVPEPKALWRIFATMQETN